MSRIDELIQEYKKAQEEITAEVEKNPKGTEAEYKEKLLAKITIILSALYVFTEKWSEENIPRLYEDGLVDSYAAIDREYKAAKKDTPNFGGWTIVDDVASNNAKTNFNAYLTNAINSTRQHMETEIQQAAMAATEQAIAKGQSTRIMQDNLIEMLKSKGIESVSYVRNGKTCYMQLDAYAELVAKTTEHEIRNTANINLGARIGNDLVKMSEHWGSCPICAPYQGRVYSVSGADTRYPYLYSTPWSSTYQNFHPRCRHVITQWIEGLHTPEENKKMQEYSGRSFEIGGEGWTKAQTKAANESLASYRQREDRIRSLYTDRKQYERYQAVLGDDAPKTFSAFRRMKTADSERWKFTELDYRRRNKLLNNPDLALPNADNATVASSKFTSYLFGGSNESGLAKGRAFDSRLGYNIGNWKELKAQIINRAQMYPAKKGEKTEYGVKYTQFIVLYGNKGRPANVKVGWIVDGETDTHMTTAYIEEIK